MELLRSSTHHEYDEEDSRKAVREIIEELISRMNTSSSELEGSFATPTCSKGLTVETMPETNCRCEVPPEVRPDFVEMNNYESTKDCNTSSFRMNPLALQVELHQFLQGMNDGFLFTDENI